MIHHIDVCGALRRSVCHLYSDLVTRPTGAAVRREIEEQLALAGGRLLTVIDFSQVGLLDFSCADEVIAKLLLRRDAQGAGHEGYFLFRGVREMHLDAIEVVLERHRLALVVESDAGGAQLVGAVEPEERRVWELLEREGRRTPAQVAAALALDEPAAATICDTLCRRRLALPVEDGVMAVGLTLLAGRPQ